MKVLMTGGFGLIGSRILEIWNGKYEVVVADLVDESDKYKNVTYTQVDITQKEEIAALIFDQKPQVVVHLAAFTDVEKAENDRDLAWEVNVNATRNLAEVSRDNGCHFIYLSTGFVFEGKKESYSEEDAPNPVNYYGLTKMEGERTLLKSEVPLTILRINYPYRGKWAKKSDTVRWMIDKMQKEEEVTLVNDQHISPTFIDDLAAVLDGVIEKRLTGTYHVTGGDCLTFVEIGKLLAEQFKVSTDLVKEISLNDFLVKSGRKAVQPVWSCLVVNKIEKALGIKMTKFGDGAKKIRESYT